ncbi:MAG: hypothetical protein HFI41_06805 [Lachnospiraceae bacterium]|nr:hypothetical protein [Lachnospiraceae bacterium]
MNLSIISFTGNGVELSLRTAEALEENSEIAGTVSLYTKCKHPGAAGQAAYVDCGIAQWAGAQLREQKALLFIGACGIAVRAVAPYLTDKLHDAPVLVMDELGRHIIPLLSGHVGGANALACGIGAAVGAEPVITTATDLNGRFAADLFAKRNDLWITDRAGIARVSSKVLAGQKITVSVEPGHERQGSRMPEGLAGIPYPPAGYADLVVSSEERDFDAGLVLRPREYIIGMGCRRGKSLEELEAFIKERIREAGILEEQLSALASIEQKKHEPGLLAWCQARRVPFLTYTARELWEAEGTFLGSSFVAETVGVDNVCERAAIKACKGAGSLVCGKYAKDGMTIAIAKRDWSVTFDET